MDTLTENLKVLSLKRKREVDDIVDCFSEMTITKKRKKVPKRKKMCSDCEILSGDKKCLNCDNNLCENCYDECKCGDCVSCCKGNFCEDCNNRKCEKLDDIFRCVVCECKFCEDCRYPSSGLEICHECVWLY